MKKNSCIELTDYAKPDYWSKSADGGEENHKWGKK